MMVTSKRNNTPAQWLVLGFLILSISAGMFFASKDPDTDWGPIILVGMGLFGLIVRIIFKIPADAEDSDGYGVR